MFTKFLRAAAVGAATLLLSAQVAHACMGVSRTITVNSFKVHMGTGSSGGIGLRRGEVVLTFDDGPAGGKTDRILSALRKECVKATFFPVGTMARANPRLLQRVAREGHTIAHHTHSHANLTRLSSSAAGRQIDRGVASVNAALGPYKRRSTKLFRYPYLARSAKLDRVLKSRGLLPFSAGIMSHDWKGGGSTAWVNRVMNQLARKGSGVILMHDIQGRTAAGLPVLLRRLKAGGYRIVHVRGRGSAKPPRSTPRGSDKPRLVASRSGVKKVRKRRSLFAVLFGRRDVDSTTTASLRKADKAKKTTAAKRRTARLAARKKAQNQKTATERKPSRFALWVKKRREARAERRKVQLAQAKKRRAKRVAARGAKTTIRRTASAYSKRKSADAKKTTERKRVWWLQQRKEGETIAEFKKRVRGNG